MQVCGVGEEKRQPGQQAAGGGAVADGPVEAVGEPGRQGHGEAGGGAAEERNPAVGHGAGERRDEQPGPRRRVEASRQKADAEHADENGGQPRRVPAAGVADSRGERGVGGGKGQVIEVRLAARGVIAQIELIDVVKERRVAAEGVQPQPKMIEQLQVVAGSEGAHDLLVFGAMGKGDGPVEKPWQGPGHPGPEHQAQQKQQAGRAKVPGQNRTSIHGGIK